MKLLNYLHTISPFAIFCSGLVSMLVLLTPGVCGQNCTITEDLLVQADDLGDPNFAGNFGWSTAMEGNVAVIGMLLGVNGNGGADVYRFSGVNWNYEATLNTLIN